MTGPVTIAAEIAAEELVARVEAGEDVHVLDVRAPERLASGRVDLVPSGRFHNVRGSQVMTAADPRALGLPVGPLLAVVCGQGKDSGKVAAHLRGHGLRATSLAGGLASWAHALVLREAAPPPSLDRLVQADRIAKGGLAYLLVSEGEAVLVDPPRRADAMLQLADRAGVRIAAVCDTHVHADYVSGGPGLAAARGVPYWLHPKDAFSPFDGRPGMLRFQPAEEGAEIRFGRTRLVAMHTPGHTEGSVTWMLPGEAAFTGDFVFVASVGRPDLGGQATEWTRDLFASLERARREWAGTLRILPAHWAAMEEHGPAGTVEGSFDALRRSNAPLALTDGAAFAAWVGARTGGAPEAYRRIKHINLGLERAGEDELDELEAGRNQCALG